MFSVIPFLCCVLVARSTIETQGLAPLFEAIRTVETGGMVQACDAVGDGGRSIGPYQISRAYWADSGVGGDWKQCKDRAFAEEVMRAYWKRYCPEALRGRNFEILARVHNGGPKGHRKTATLPYWKVIRIELVRTPTARAIDSGTMASGDGGVAAAARRT